MKPSPLALAQRLDSYGWNVLPAPVREKSPIVSWKKWQDRRCTAMLASWFGGRESNFWVATGGVSGLYVLDVDNDTTEAWWRDEVGFGEEMDRTVAVKSRKGHHYYFWIPPNDQARGWAIHDERLDFDIRGSGGGVIAPPSIHETGFQYEWLREPDPEAAMMGMVPAPDWLKSKEAVNARIEARGGSRESAAVAPVQVRSMLSALLASPPAEGGRNDWLTKVAGHYARTYRKMPDLYWSHLSLANNMLADPLDRAEFEKTGNSVFNAEFENHAERGMGDETGWLLSGGDRLMTQASTGKGEDRVLSVEQFADFDLRVQGVIRSSEDPGNLLYECRMSRQRGDRETHLDVMIPGKTLGDGRALAKFLAGYGATVSRPDGTFPKNPPDHVRLQRYLESQEAPASEMSATLGWHAASGSFLTFDGVIRPDGAHPFAGVRPDPRLREQGRARFHYGMAPLEEAREVLRQVLTFHEPETVAVFASWWAATLIKPQLQARASLFPLMAIEAASGAGKTNGFFALMLQLAGGLAGATQGTIASSRDRIAAHRSGIVWIDDLDSLERLHEILRATTSNETITKKGIDNSANVNIPLVAPVVVSGEALGLGSQKALIDRVVALAPGRPDGRTSVVAGREGRPQWDDIVELTGRHPLAPGATGGESDGLGLAVFAGALQAAALGLASGALERMESARRELKAHSGRQAEKLSILVAGAWLLDRLAGEGEFEQQVLVWVETGAATNGSAGDWDNRATVEIIPWALAEAAWPKSPRGKPAVWVERDEDDLLGPAVWVNCLGLAEAWAGRRGVRLVERTDTSKAIQDQLVRCDAVAKLHECGRGRSDRNQARYWKIEGDAARVVLERSRG